MVSSVACGGKWEKSIFFVCFLRPCSLGATRWRCCRPMRRAPDVVENVRKEGLEWILECVRVRVPPLKKNTQKNKMQGKEQELLKARDNFPSKVYSESARTCKAASMGLDQLITSQVMCEWKDVFRNPSSYLMTPRRDRTRKPVNPGKIKSQEHHVAVFLSMGSPCCFSLQPITCTGHTGTDLF